MSRILALTAAAALFATTAVAPTFAQTMNDEQCKAEFAKVDADRNDRLDDDRLRDYDTVMSQVDVDKDGSISADEYIVACKAGALDKVRKGGA